MNYFKILAIVYLLTAIKIWSPTKYSLMNFSRTFSRNIEFQKILEHSEIATQSRIAEFESPGEMSFFFSSPFLSQRFLMCPFQWPADFEEKRRPSVLSLQMEALERNNLQLQAIRKGPNCQFRKHYPFDFI
jgi:hypothetical protein